jgi:hypothetical protein
VCEFNESAKLQKIAIFADYSIKGLKINNQLTFIRTPIVIIIYMVRIRIISVALIISLGLIFLGGCSKDDSEAEKKEALIRKITGDINADSLEAQVKWLQGMGTRFALSGNRRNVAVSIRNRYITMGYNNARIDSFIIVKTYRGISYTQMQYNVIASLGSGTSSDSLCIVGGHYDNILSTGDPFTFVPGANDNASGVAAAIEIARVLKMNDYVAENEIVFIAFGAEELGLYGSYAFADNAKRTIKKIKLMLNNDMIAYEPSNDRSSWMVNIIDYPNSKYLRKEAESLCMKYTDLKPFNDNTSSAYSDSYPFYLNGFKALFFFSRLMDPAYHSVNDVATNCNFEYCREIVKLNCAILINKN